ncbi:MAG: ribosomal protein S18-alanine N-acetyltransferase [Lachnospiraceae bacterium]|nr:ribosomal protein S18-alanine N-acetyltransferase [Lachnospiraceae bacterium]
MITYGHMKLTDCERVAALEKEAFGHDAWTAEDFRESLCCDYAVYVVARDTETAGAGEGDVSHPAVACAGIRNMCGDGDITNVLVEESYRRRGIAGSLLRYLFEEGRTIGVRNFTLEVRVSNTPAIRLYEKLGFISEGIRPGFYDAPKEDAIIFWKREG